MTRTRSSSDDIDLRAIGSATLRALPRLAILSAIVAAVTYVALASLAPRYQSEATLAIVSKGDVNPYSDPTRLNTVDSTTTRMDKEAINTHVRALQSSDLAEKVIRELKLTETAEFNPSVGYIDWWAEFLGNLGVGRLLPNETEVSRAIRTYQKMIEVYSPKESRSIGIRFSSVDPDRAAAVPNALIAVYREALASKTVDETDEVQRVLEAKITDLAKEAAAAEEAVEKFRGEANIFKGGGKDPAGLNEQQLSELNAELTKVKAARGEAEARAKEARDMMASGNADSLPDVQKSQLMQNLIQSRVRVERQISEASATLLPGHPRMRQLYAEQQGLKRQIDNEVAKIVESISKEAKVAGMREEAMSQNLAEVKTRIVDTGPNEAKLRSLEANAKSKRAELERLRSQFESNRARGADSRAVPVEAQVVAMARPQSVPVFPRKTASSALAGLATLLLGVALIVTRSLLSGMADTRPMVPPYVPSAAAMANPVPGLSLGTGPDLYPERRVEQPAAKPAAPALKPPPSKPAAAPASQAAKSAPAPAPNPPHAVVKSNVRSTDDIARILERHAAKSEVGVRTLIVSDMLHTRVADEVWSLATAILAADRSLIIVDWNLKGEGIAAALEHPAAPGLVELLKGAASFEEVIGPVLETDVHMIPAGYGKGDEGDDIDVGRVADVLDALDGVYDHIVLVARTGPASEVFEALEGRFDVGVLIAEAGAEVGPQMASPGHFLGFEVESFDVAVYTPFGPATSAVPDKLPKAG